MWLKGGVNKRNAAKRRNLLSRCFKPAGCILSMPLTFGASSLTRPSASPHLPASSAFHPMPLALTVVATSQRAMALPTRSIP